jgi:hypothetical protein
VNEKITFTKTNMKKILLEILLGVGLSSAIFHNQVSNLFTTEKPVNKEINFSITRDSSYDGNVYDMTRATVRIIVFKVKNHKQVVLWNKTYDTMQVKQYPTSGNALCQTVKVKNILDRKEQLYITYIITYNTKGSVIKVENGTSVLKGEKEGRLAINI